MKTINISAFGQAQQALKNANLAQALYEEGGVVMDDALISLHGKAHHKRRVTEFKVFSRGFFRYYEREVYPRTLAKTLQPFVDQGKADLVEFGYRATINLTADFAGIDRPEQSVEETECLLKLVKLFSEGATLVHSTRDRDVVRAEVSSALEEFSERFLEPSRNRRRKLISAFDAGDISEDELPRDVMTVLLRNQDKLQLSEAVFRREIAFYMQAGAHSTANSTTHALHELFQWCAAHPDAWQRLEDDPRFLQRCVHESLRLHPASPVAWRRAMCPFAIDDATPVGDGDKVIVDLHAANRDVGVFGADADRFNPNRQLPNNIWPFGLSFGYGVHACMGRDLDGGVIPRDDMPPEKHQMGIVASLVGELLGLGARPDPNDPPTADTHTERSNWGRYPVLFDPARVAAYQEAHQ